MFVSVNQRQENVIVSHVLTRHASPIDPVPESVLRAVPPVVSVCLPTAGAVPEAAALVGLHWRNMRRSMAQQGAHSSALTALDSAVAGAYLTGETLVAIADDSGLLYQAHLPGVIDTEQAVVSPVANLVPLLTGTQPMLAHLVVLIDRLGADLITVSPDLPDHTSRVDGHYPDVTTSAPRGTSPQRLRQRAQNRWASNAGGVAHALTRLVDDNKPHLVVVCGDGGAVQLLLQQVPTRVADLITVLGGEHHDQVQVRMRSSAAAASVAETQTQALVAQWRQKRPHGLAVRGSSVTLAALSAGQAGVLLLDADLTQQRRAWAGPQPTQVAARSKTLATAGIAERKRAPLADVAVRAALAGHAQIRIVPAGTPELGPSGIGALLRYR